MKLLANKRGIIMGVVNANSIAFGIAKQFVAHGAEIAITYQRPSFEQKIRNIMNDIGVNNIFVCDVAGSEDIQKLFHEIQTLWGSIDFIVHCPAFARKEALQGKFFDVSRDDFLEAINISCYSFVETVKIFSGILNSNSSVLALSYYGAQKVIPNYNVMGIAKAALEAAVRYLAVDLGPRNIRVNAISSGPIKTLAAIGGINDFKEILRISNNAAPIVGGVTIEDIGNSAVYFTSDLANKVTGEIHNVDCGYNIIGLDKSSEH